MTGASALGYLDNAFFEFPEYPPGHPIPTQCVFVSYTTCGDANFDYLVNGAGYGLPISDWPGGLSDGPWDRIDGVGRLDYGADTAEVPALSMVGIRWRGRGQFLPLPLRVSVTSNGLSAPGGPVTFSVVNGNGFLGVGENGALAMSVRVRANVSGNAQAWVCLAGDVSGPVTIQATVPGSAPVFFVAHPLAAPHNLTARALSPFSIDLAWQAGSGAPAGSGFVIERREALAATGPFTPWHELTRYFGTATTFQDQRLAAGQVAMYRVQAFVGSGSAERHSAPSNLAMQAMWQDPNTPSADPGGGEDGDGDGALGDPTGGEGGDNNYWIAGDGDGDGDPDNDKDGIVDTGDRYPEDPRRSEDIPVKFYGVIDLSAALAESFTVTNAITAPGGKALISIDDTNRVGFAGIEQLPNGQSIIRSATWFNGVATQSSRLLYDQSGNDWKQYLPEPYGVTPEGLVIGNFIGTYGQVDQNVSPLSWPGYFTFQNGLLSLHASTPPTGPRTYTSVLLMSPSGRGDVPRYCAQCGGDGLPCQRHLCQYAFGL